MCPKRHNRPVCHGPQAALRDSSRRFSLLLNATATGALLGSLAGAICALFDTASTILWLSSGIEQARLVVTLVSVGFAAGGIIGSVVALAAAGDPQDPFASHVARVARACAAPLAIVAYLLFTGGWARRLPAVWALRPAAWIV